MGSIMKAFPLGFGFMDLFKPYPLKADKMEKAFQVMSGPSLVTYGVYIAETPEAALDQWAADSKWGTWKDAQEKGGDLFKNGFHLKEGFRIILD